MSKAKFSPIEKSTSSPKVSRAPDMLAKDIRMNITHILGTNEDEFSVKSPSVLAGHCYNASEVYYHSVDKSIRKKLTPQQMTITVNHDLFDDTVEVSHWFLKHDNGSIIDLTIDQFDVLGIDIDHEEATGRGFVPPSPCKKSQKLLDALQSTVNQ